MTDREARSQKSHSVLESLVRVAYSLASQNDLRKLFNTIPNSGKFGPNVKSSLPIAVGKLGRYYSTCSFLIAAARRLSIFKTIRIESVRFPVPAVPPCSTAQPEPSLSGTLGRILGPRSETLTQTIVKSSMMNRGISLASAEARFRRHLITSPNTHKIHAEIQLLYYYEMHPEIRRPRVICSSKSACFLCDLFIKTHAKFYMARTHGVLYNKWTLPDPRPIHLPAKEMKEMVGVVERFNTIIEDKIKSALPMQRMLRCHPNESAFIEPATWTSSAISLTTSTASQVVDTLNPAIRLKEQIANVGVLGRGLALSTTGDEGAVRVSGNSVERTLSRTTPEMPAIDSGSTSDVAIKGEKGRVSPASQDLFNRPTCASPLSQYPVRDTSQLDFSGQRYPTSSGSLHRLNPSLPIRRSVVIAPNHQLLIRGQWIERELPTGGLPVRLSTDLIHLILSYDWAEAEYEVGSAEYQKKMQEDRSPDRCHLFKVKWMTPDEEPKRCSGARSNIIDLDEMEESIEETMGHGAASASTELYIRRQVDIVMIKFVTKE